MQKYLRGQIWWCKALDENNEENSLSSVQSGTRPVLIVSNNIGNKFSQTLQVVPCTSSEKLNNQPTHYSIFIEKKKNTFLCEQLKCIMKTDLLDYVTTLDDFEMKKIEECLQVSLGIKMEEVNVLKNEVIGGKHEHSTNRNTKNDD